MTLLITALDNQFAASTGSNVNSSPGMSTFDYPPTSTNSLIIESQPGDPTPYIFSPGDTYTLTFSGQGGTTLADATVLRSDFIDLDGDTGYAVVFEGTNSFGDTVQVVWTPDFDLQTWYWNNFNAGHPPGFYNTDQSPTTYQAPCFEAETPILTPSGPRAAATLAVGDAVITRDAGAQPIRWISRHSVVAEGRAAPIRIETGVIGNHAPLELSRQHRVALRSPLAEARHGAPEVLVPALSLVNGATVRPVPRPRVGYVHLLLARHHLIDAAGALCETLLMGPAIQRQLRGTSALAADPGLTDLSQTPCRPVLTMRQGADLWQETLRATGVKRAVFGHRGKKAARVLTFVPVPGRNCLDSRDI